MLAIAFEWLHITTAALAGLTANFLITYVEGAINPGLYIFSFDRGLSYINDFFDPLLAESFRLHVPRLCGVCNRSPG